MMGRKALRRGLLLAVGATILGLPGSGVVLSGAVADAAPAAAPAASLGNERPYSPPLRQGEETSLFWGDLHLHSNQSFDAFTNGTHAVGPDDAFRFARGEKVTADGGLPARLRRPYDFVAVTDHAEFLGVSPLLAVKNPRVMAWPLGRKWAGMLAAGETTPLIVEFSKVVQQNSEETRTPSGLVRTLWQDVGRRADRFNEPGRFTALVGYEWTSMIAGDNLHRVVLFRDGAKETAGLIPFTSQDSVDPEDLWTRLEAYEAAGAKVLAIAHNGNVSNGRMFAPTRLNGEPLNARYAERRSRWEPVYEVTQVKGDGETHPALSPGDEFADFETWDKGNITLSHLKEPWMLQYEYARMGLRNGLLFERKLGANPFKFGMIGSTDSHTGLSTAEEDNFFGKFVESEPSADRWKNKMAGVLEESWELGASGLTAVWAIENSRGAIFDALMRREVYGTTGSRIRLRFFGGWDYARGDIGRADYARVGYARGVPMGSDLPGAKGRGAPRFLVHAVRDPDSANLDRVQVIKGWLDAAGQTHERVYDVALSRTRKPGRDGKAPPVGSTVDTKTARWTNTIGAPELATWWQDPDFDPQQPAFYYVRVIEIPRPRWTAYDAAYYGVTMPANVRMTVQDRAYSSPIWYRP